MERKNLEIVELGVEAIVSEEVVLGMRHWKDWRHVRVGHCTTFSSNLMDILVFGGEMQ